MRYIPAALFICLILASACPAVATEAAFEKALARGVAALEANQPVQAASEFRAALEEHPHDPGANLYLGIALSRSDDPGAEHALKKALALAPDNQRTNLELGILYYRKNVTTEAADHFETVASNATDADLVAQARSYLGKLDTEGGRRWELRATTGMQYDTNVVLNVAGVPLPPGVSHKADWRALVSLQGAYSLHRSEKSEQQIEYDFFQSLHFAITEFNVTQNLLKLSTRHELADNLSLQGNYTLEQVLLGGDAYDYSHTFSAIGAVKGDSAATSLEGRYRYTTFKNSDLFTTNSERTGSNYLLGLQHQRSLGTSMTVRTGYAFDMDRADHGGSWDYDGHRGSIGVTVPIPWALQFNLESAAHWRSYRGAGGYAGYDRRDTSWTTNIMLNKMLNQNYGVTAGFYLDRTYSNVAVFDYSRGISSLLFNMRF